MKDVIYITVECNGVKKRALVTRDITTEDDINYSVLKVNDLGTHLRNLLIAVVREVNKNGEITIP